MTNILLVDDDELFAGMLHKALATLGHAVIRARNGREALQLYDPQTVGLVLTDLIMPDVALPPSAAGASPTIKLPISCASSIQNLIPRRACMSAPYYSSGSR